MPNGTAKNFRSQKIYFLFFRKSTVLEQNFIGIYENGIGFGNLSFRYKDNFIITASATGGARELGMTGYTLVNSVDIAKNTVHSMGPLPASSETMSHASVYQNSTLANYVLHIHNSMLFNFLKERNALSTPEDIGMSIAHLQSQLTFLCQEAKEEQCMHCKQKGEKHNG